MSSDTATDWLGEGEFVVKVENGEVEIIDNFDEEPLTVAGFANMHDEDEYWALEYIHGEEVAEEFDKYLKQCNKEGVEAVDADTWLAEIYEVN